MNRLKFRYVFAVYAAVLFFVCMCMIYPAEDDFFYAAPNPDMNIIAGLMPTTTYWRPLHNMMSYFLGRVPFLWPYLNLAITLMCHFMLCAILYSLIKRMTRSKLNAIAGLLFFCMSPGIVYPVTNSDIFEQGLAAMTGAVSVYFFFRAKTTNKPHVYVFWFIQAFIATVIREEGIAWFLAPVMLFMVYSYAEHDDGMIKLLKDNYRHLLAGLAGMLLYFAVRFYLMGSVRLGVSDSDARLSLNFSMINIVKNYCLIIGSAVTSVDALAIFVKPRNFPVIAITSLVSLVFLVYIFVCLKHIYTNNRKTFKIIAGLFICAGYISSPFTVMNHVADNTTYEMLFMCSLILGVILSSSKKSTITVIILSVMLLCMTFVQGHKFYTMHKYTFNINQFIDLHKNDFSRVPSKAFVYYVKDIPDEGYSVYIRNLGRGLCGGRAFNSVWGWRTTFGSKEVDSEAEINFSTDIFPEYDTIFSLASSGKLNVLRN